MPADPLSVPCQVCGAEVQNFCTRPDGTVAPWTHRGRDRRAATRAAIDAEFGPQGESAQRQERKP